MKPRYICAMQVGNVAACSTTINAILYVYLFIAKLVEYVLGLPDLMKRISESENERVMMSYNFDGVWNSSTSMVNQ